MQQAKINCLSAMAAKEVKRARRRSRYLEPKRCQRIESHQQQLESTSTRTTSEDLELAQMIMMAREAADRLAMPIEQMTTARGRHGTRNRIIQRRPTRRPTSVSLAGGLVFCSVLSTILMLLLHLSHDTLGAVIRPTIFSDLPPDSPSTTANSQVAQQAAVGPQQQPSTSQVNSNQIANPSNNNIGQPPRPSTGSHHILGQTHWQQHSQSQQQQQQLHHPHQADGPQTPKITPLKSRFCSSGSATSGHHNHHQRLDQALGMQSYAIDDLSLSASSFSNEQVRPHLARLNLDVMGGAWCPMKPISASNFGKEWIQVKFNRSYVISALETQGRFAMGSGKEFVPSYQIEYSRNNGLTWHKWKDFKGSSLLRANEDVNTGVRNELSPPIVGANVIRILPFSAHLRTVCLRFELYGCQYDEGAPISYSTNDGVVEPRWGHLIDYTYDGLRLMTHLSGGLGQLVDGVKGPDNFSVNNGFEWVGWKSMNGDLVIEFTFKTLRNFTGALFHSNNLFSSGVEVFQGVDVHYGIDINLSLESLRDSLWERERRQASSLTATAATGGAPLRIARQSADQETLASATGGTLWSQDVLSIEYEPDKKAESSRPVTVHLKQRLANKLRFHLKFASKWILLSEVEFLSRPVELMSLASLSEQLTPRLMGELALAKTYDQYVAILREHQLRRIAADEYMLQLGNGGASSTSTSASLLDATQSSTQVVDTQPDDQSGQDLSSQQQQQPPSDNSLGQIEAQDYLATGRRQVAELGSPATNPFLANMPPPGFGFDASQSPSMFADRGGLAGNTIDQQQQQQQVPATAASGRTLGVATVISFVFVALLGMLGLLFAISSYRLRSRGPKLGSPTALPRHALGGASGTGKSFMSSVFAAQHSSSDSSADSSAGSFVGGHAHHHHAHSHQQTTGYLGRPAVAAHMAAAAAYHQSGSGDSHYNPLFASASGRSSEGSLRGAKSGGPLSSLRKLASLTTGRSSLASKEAKLMYQHQAMMQAQNAQQQQPSQLLVSLKDSISSSGGKPFTGQTSSQAIATGQLIVGLNQANPLAHQQIYNQQQQQAIYGQQQHYNSNSATNSMSLTASSSSQNNQKSSNGGDFSLAASGDYATPDLQAPSTQQSTMSPFTEPFGLRASTRLAHHQQQRMLMAEHNYEQISGEQQQVQVQQARFNASTLHHAHHQRTFSNQMQPQVAAVQHNGTITMCPPQDSAWRLARQPLSNTDSSSHYYYADTDAAKSCLSGGK